MGILIGRKREIQLLRRLQKTERSEFLAVYGRRRVGKTYLIKETFQNEFTFSHTGLAPVNESDTESKYTLGDQLKHFRRSLQAYGYKGRKCPTTWLEAFYMLEDLLTRKEKEGRAIVFIDELPWMDTPRSKLIQAIDAFWNSWCNGRNVLFIVCGSAASWMLDNVINQRGGLYGRVTAEIKLSPFTLAETEKYFEMLDVRMSRYDMSQAYMTIGGIPYYLNYWQPDLSLVQNIDYLFFSNNARLRHEFSRLFKSLFAHPEQFIQIVRLLGTRRGGYSRKDICEKTGIESGSGLTKTLEALESSDFIQPYTPFGQDKGARLYRLTDPYCLFFLDFIDNKPNDDPNYWQNNFLSPSLNSWRGLAFEELCLLHIPQIKHALGIDGVTTTASNWILRGRGEQDGTQIDLILSRADNVVNLCELKFYVDEYQPTKDDDMKMRHRISAVQEQLNRRQSLRVTLVTSFGLSTGKYSGIYTNVVTLDDLFG